MKQNIKRIFTKKLACQLRRRGFTLIGTEPNIYRPAFDVYLFEASPELSVAITELDKLNKSQKK